MRQKTKPDKPNITIQRSIDPPSHPISPPTHPTTNLKLREYPKYTVLSQPTSNIQEDMIFYSRLHVRVQNRMKRMRCRRIRHVIPLAYWFFLLTTGMTRPPLHSSVDAALAASAFTSSYTSSSSSSSSSSNSMPPPAVLRQLLQSEMDDTRSKNNNCPILLPCCYDGLTARLVARAGFEATFLTGFGASAVHGFPDTQLISFGEMQAACYTVAEALASVALENKNNNNNNKINNILPPIPCIADGDTGYGNAVNVKRTVFGYARAGMAGIMIEDQVAPKRCGHVSGKSVVSRQEAVQRVQAACHARDEYEALYGPGTGPVILARTDAIKTHGFQEGIERCLAFREVAGCDMTFLEAPESVEQMKEYCATVPGPKLANMLEYGTTPILPPAELKQMGYTVAAYPLTLLSASIKAMQESLMRIQQGLPTDNLILSFEETKDAVGFSQYSIEENRYRVD